MSNSTLDESYNLKSIYILEALDCEGEVLRRGTCFSISDNHVLTAKHVVNEAVVYKCYLKTDDFVNNNYCLLEFQYSEDDWDFAILKLSEGSFSDFSMLGEIVSEIGMDLKVCGYPAEKRSICAPMSLKITNVYGGVYTHNYSFELTQSQTVKNYAGMSGSPITYDGYAVGVLVVQQGSTTLKAISIPDILKLIGTGYPSLCVEYSSQEEIDYIVPAHPPSPFETCLDCNRGVPNIKGIEIGFDYGVWRREDLISFAGDWIVDYSLTASQKESLINRPRKQMKEAIGQFNHSDINVMSDLFLHMAIRKNYKTIPIVNKVINTQDGDAFSCSHVVINKGQLEIWLGASIVEKELGQAAIKVARNINNILTIPNIKNRLVLITSEMDSSWPFKERLMRISDNSIPLEERFDRIVVPVFITHNSDLINSYDKENFLHLFQAEIDGCREIISNNFNSNIIKLIDLKVFVFPVDDGELLHENLLEELA